MKAGYILRTQMSAAVKVNCFILRCSSYLMLHWKPHHQQGLWQPSGHWCLLILWNNSFVREIQGKASLPDLHYFLLSQTVYFTQLTVHLLQPIFRCVPAGHTGNCASRPENFLTIGLRHLLHTCYMAGTWTELLILLFDFCIPVFKCCLCNLCLASPQKFGGRNFFIWTLWSAIFLLA